jgi:hypothetical protein
LFNTYRPQSEHGEAHQWFGDGCYTLVYTAGGKGVEHKQHNIAVCIADDTETDENPEWRVNGGKKVGRKPGGCKDRVHGGAGQIRHAG